MQIILKMDIHGEPYIVLQSETPAVSSTTACIESEVLEYFIREAKTRELILKNESSFNNSCAYASIRLGSVKKFTDSTCNCQGTK